MREADVVINMSGRSGAQLATQDGPRIEDWEVGDPFGSDLDVYRKICDDIELRLANFAEELKSSQKPGRKAAPETARREHRTKRGV